MLFFDLVFCITSFKGLFPTDDRFNFRIRSPSGNDEQVVSSATEVLAPLASQHATGGLKDNAK